MTTEIEVVFENGVFRPLVEADFKENHRYKMIVEEQAAESSERINGVADVVEPTEKPDTYCIREMEWLSKHRHEYPGEYVALDGDCLVSHGTDGREVYRQARAAGVKVQFMAHIELSSALVRRAVESNIEKGGAVC